MLVFPNLKMNIWVISGKCLLSRKKLKTFSQKNLHLIYKVYHIIINNTEKKTTKLFPKCQEKFFKILGSNYSQLSTQTWHVIGEGISVFQISLGLSTILQADFMLQSQITQVGLHELFFIFLNEEKN